MSTKSQCKKQRYNAVKCKLPDGHKGPHVWMTHEEKMAHVAAREEAQRTEKARAIGCRRAK